MLVFKVSAMFTLILCVSCVLSRYVDCYVLLLRPPLPSSRVEEENASNQKLANERANAENKIKALEEQVTLNDDNIGKVYSTALVKTTYSKVYILHCR